MLPVMLNVRDRPCLVVGAGSVALRKVLSLLAAGAKVTIVAPQALPDLTALAEGGRVVHEQRAFRAGDTAGFTLVFAATDQSAVNRQVFQEAETRGVLANVADDPELCSFHVPARVTRGALEIAIASSGGAPFVSRRLRSVIEARMGHEWTEWTDAAHRFRQRVKELGLPHEAQEELYDRFFAETVDAGRFAVTVPTSEEMEGWLAPRASAPSRESSAPPPRTADLGPRAAPAGLVSLVGSGPGAPGLLTVRGLDRLRRADAVVYDRLAEGALPPDLPAHVELHCVGKTAGNHPVRQEEINATLIRLAQAGKRVVRLKGGDPYVFGRGSEEAEALDDAGIAFEVIPGVTSGIAATGYAGIPVTHRREAVRVTLVTAHEAVKRDGPQIRWDLLAQDPSGTIVGYMGVTALRHACAELLAYGMDPSTPAAMVERGTSASQRTLVSTLADLPDDAERAEIAPPALFVIGKTVRHAARLDWRVRLPLTGQRIAVALGTSAAVRALDDAGAEVVPLPFPLTPAARIALGALPITGCVLASVVEVDAIEEERDGLGFSDGVMAWCVGGETAARARRHGWRNVLEISSAADVEAIARHVRAHRALGEEPR